MPCDMQALLDSSTGAHDAGKDLRNDGGASPEPPAAITPMTRGVDTVARGGVADLWHEGDAVKASPAPPAADVSPKVSVSNLRR